MKLKKRKKSSRLRGSRTAGWGFRQKHKGPGNKGGRGMAGSGKRADHKKQKALMIANKAGFEEYFGKKGFTSRHTAKKKGKVINLRDVVERFGGGKVELKGYKVLGVGEGFKGEIICDSASKGAVEKMEGAGGKIFALDKSKIKNNKSENFNEIVVKGKKQIDF